MAVTVTRRGSRVIVLAGNDKKRPDAFTVDADGKVVKNNGGKMSDADIQVIILALGNHGFAGLGRLTHAWWWKGGGRN